MKKFLLVIFLILLISSFAFGASYTKYVKSGGSDVASGDADGTAWATKERVNTFLKTLIADDVAVVSFKEGDTWNNPADEYLGDSVDLPDSTVTFNSYGLGANPVFDTEQQAFFLGSENTSPKDTTNITIKDIKLYGSSSSIQYAIQFYRMKGTFLIDGVDGDGRGDGAVTSDNGAKVVHIYGCSGTVEIKNCNISGFGPASNPDNIYLEKHNAFVIWNNDSEPQLTSFSIHDNNIDSMDADGVHVAGFDGTAVNKGLIYNNDFLDCGENGIDLKENHHVYIYNNTFKRDGWGLENVAGPHIVSHTSTGADMNGDCDDIYIYENYFQKNYAADGYHKAGIGIATTHNSIDIYNNKFKNCEPFIAADYGEPLNIYNNIFIADTALSGYGTNSTVVKAGTSTSTINFINNSIYGHTGSNLRYGILMSTAHVLTAKNNLFYLTESDSYSFHFSSYSPTVDYNTHYVPNATNIIYYNGSNYTSATFSNYKTACGGSEEQNRDPKYSNAASGDLWLASDSNEINAGHANESYPNGLIKTSTFGNGNTVVKELWSLYGSAPERGAFNFVAIDPILSALNPNGSQSCEEDPLPYSQQATTDIPCNCKWHLTDVVYASCSETYDVTGRFTHTDANSKNCESGSITHYTKCQNIYSAANIGNGNNTFEIGGGSPPQYGGSGSMLIISDGSGKIDLGGNKINLIIMPPI